MNETSHPFGSAFQSPCWTHLARVLSVLCAVLCASGTFAVAHAQDESGTLRQGFQSPNAASLGRFGEIPVSLHTGTPEIAIPLLTLQEGEMEVPVSLRYHARGLRVPELGGVVGMGWTLEAGGAITRTVVGLPDDHADGFFNTGQRIYTEVPSNTSTDADLDYIVDIVNARADSDPDRYFYNVSGGAGEFAVGFESATGPSIVVPLRRTSWQFIGRGPWTIKDPRGVQYDFNETETTFDTSRLSAANPAYPFDSIEYPSTWYLTQMSSPVGASQIDFSYANRGVADYEVNGMHQAVRQICDGDPGYTNTESKRTMKYEIRNQRTISTIETSTERVRFEYSLRDDARDPDTGARQSYKLDAVIHETIAGTRIRRFEMGYTYLDSRLFLTSVTEYGETNQSALPPYQIEYLSTALPDPLSYSIDHWGYANGAYNTDLIAEGYYIGLDAVGRFHAGADRSPDATQVLARMIRKITYPTGGSTTFEFESNDYSGTSGGPAGQYVNQRSATISASGTGSNSATLNVTIPDTPRDPEYVRLYASYTPLDPSSTPPPRPSATFNGDGGIAPSGNTDDPVVWTVYVDPGTYALGVSAYNLGDEVSAYVEYDDYEVSSPTNSVNVLGGGVRIRSVLNDDGAGNVTQRLFSYRLSSDPSKSSGVLVSEPDYSYTHSDDACAVFARVGASYVPLERTSGSPVGYSEVRETVAGAGETIYRYRTALDAPAAGSVGGPVTRVSNTDWKRSQETDRSYLHIDGSTLHEVENRYEFLDGPKIKGFSVAFFGWGMYGWNTNTHQATVIANESSAKSIYWLTSGWTRVVETKETRY
ncbi:MAG: hypothetical protein AAGG50_07685 [Bacteroidota bacterium]